MTKMLKLKHAIIENFVLPADVEKMEERCQWDEDEERWVLQKRTAESGGLQIRSQRPQSALGTRQHQTRAALEGAFRGNTRHKSENVITLELEMPQRTTFDYDPSYFNGNIDYNAEYGLHGGAADHYHEQQGYHMESQYEGQDYAQGDYGMYGDGQYDQLNFQDSMNDGGDMYSFDR